MISTAFVISSTTVFGLVIVVITQAIYIQCLKMDLRDMRFRFLQNYYQRFGCFPSKEDEEFFRRQPMIQSYISHAEKEDVKLYTAKSFYYDTDKKPKM